MQYNGYIQFKVITGGGGLENGDPIPVMYSWSNPVGCLIRKLKHEHQYCNEGNFLMQSYEILLEAQDFDAYSIIKLTDSKGTELGEFEVQDISDVERSGRIKIKV